MPAPGEGLTPREKRAICTLARQALGSLEESLSDEEFDLCADKLPPGVLIHVEAGQAREYVRELRDRIPRGLTPEELA